MKVSQKCKPQILNTIWDITKISYTGVELPEENFFRRAAVEGDVFMHFSVAYALVTPDSICLHPLLRSIAVMPMFRGQGIGRLLLDELAEYYAEKGARTVLLHCKVDNPAQKLYFDAGYRVRAYLRNYYRPEGDGLEMEKKL